MTKRMRGLPCCLICASTAGTNFWYSSFVNSPFARTSNTRPADTVSKLSIDQLLIRQVQQPMRCPNCIEHEQDHTQPTTQTLAANAAIRSKRLLNADQVLNRLRQSP